MELIYYIDDILVFVEKYNTHRHIWCIQVYSYIYEEINIHIYIIYIVNIYNI